jgi:DNA-binding NarL/FixJ family response regulator
VTQRIRIVIADDHPLVLRGLAHLLDDERDLEVVAQCRDGVEALAAVRTHHPDVLVLDIRMPVKDGLQALRELKAEGNATRVVLLVSTLTDDELLEAIRLGVRGLLFKEMAPQLFVPCIRKAHAGEVWMERGATSRALETLLRREAGARELSTLLTPREIEIVRKVLQRGLTKEVARALNVSESTVKTHLHSVYEKLHVVSRGELMAYCRDKGII